MKHAPLLFALLCAGPSLASAEDAFSERVLQPGGKEPAAGIVLELRDAYRESVCAKATLRTTQRGEFSVTGSWLSANLPDWVTLVGLAPEQRRLLALHATQTLEVAPGKDVEVRLTLGSTIRGVARRPDGSASLGVVEAATPLAPIFRVAKAEADGTYLLEGLARRSYELRISDNGQASALIVSVTGPTLTGCDAGRG